MASLQPVLVKIFEVKIGGRIHLSTIHYLHVDRKIFLFLICLIYQKFELMEFFCVE